MSVSTISTSPFDDQLDLAFERVVPVTPEQVWAAWTEPEHLVHWFTPAPWETVAAEVDLRPGGVFRTVMRSPEGDENDGSGCYLEIVEHRRLVWTGALGPGYRPNDFSEGGFPFTAELTFDPVDGGTRYAARVMHATTDASSAHAEMGFLDGWSAALDQLVTHMSGR